VKYFFAVALVWFGCLVAWVALGGTLVYRSGSMSSELTQEVDQLWGPPLVQRPPVAGYRQIEKEVHKVTTTDAQGRATQSEVERDVEKRYPIPLTRSEIGVRLDLEHRKKGLIWFPTYAVDFKGRYEIHNDTAIERKVELSFPLATENAVYDGFRVRDGASKDIPVAINENAASFERTLAPGERASFDVGYRSRGRSEWRYQPTEGTGKVEHFHLSAQTNFPKVDFPAGTLSPSRHADSGSGWKGDWTFDSLISSAPIGIELPQKVNPGPLASRITFFAPVGLLFFFFVAAVLSKAKERPLHPMHYFFLGCAFFAFHLLFAYLVDHLSVEVTFVIASLVSVFLVLTYARLFIGWRLALALLGLPQLIYLVLFSYTFFWEGYTGLAIAIGAVLTLFVIMQITGRVRWDDRTRHPEPLPGAA
jgi:hypothetical protein